MKPWIRVHVGGQEWSVYRVRPSNKHLEGNAGMCEQSKCRIFLNNDANEQSIQDTLLHELLHAVLYVAGTGLKSDTEEHVVGASTPILHRLLKDLGFVFPRSGGLRHR